MFTQLSSWHLCSDRSYTLTALLFPYEKSIPHLEAITHIKTALQRLAKHRPDFTGSLILGPFGKSIYLYQSGNNEIPFVVGDPLEDQDTSYGRLQAQGFPLRAFTQPGLKTAARLSEWATKPVIHVQMTFLDGGLLLAILLHNSFADSDGMRMILECFAACTRGETPPEYPQDGDIDPFEFRANALAQHWKGRKKTFDELLKQTPEFSHHPAQAEPMGFYTRATSNMPPQTIPQISVTFVFPKRRLEILKENVTRHLISSVEPLSTFAVLAGLTWAHVTRAQKQSCPQAWAADPDGLAQLFMAVSWRSRVTATQAVKQYFGPAAVTPVVRDGCDRVLAACQEKTGRALAHLVSQVHDSIQGVDDLFVATRSAVRRAAVDGEGQGPNALGVDHEPRNPRHLIINSWVDIGMDTEWDIPGVGQRVKPAAIRDVRESFDAGIGLVLPGREYSNVYELNLNLGAGAVDVLVKDKGFMQWVDRVVI